MSKYTYISTKKRYTNSETFAATHTNIHKHAHTNTCMHTNKTTIMHTNKHTHTCTQTAHAHAQCFASLCVPRSFHAPGHMCVHIQHTGEHGHAHINLTISHTSTHTNKDGKHSCAIQYHNKKRMLPHTPSPPPTAPYTLPPSLPHSLERRELVKDARRQHADRVAVQGERPGHETGGSQPSHTPPAHARCVHQHAHACAPCTCPMRIHVCNVAVCVCACVCVFIHMYSHTIIQAYIHTYGLRCMVYG